MICRPAGHCLENVAANACVLHKAESDAAHQLRQQQNQPRKRDEKGEHWPLLASAVPAPSGSGRQHTGGRTQLSAVLRRRRHI